MTDRELMQMALDALETITSKVAPMSYYCSFAVEIESLRAALAQPEQEIESDRPHAEDDGCPTEKAVLQRFWRKHQAQPERKLWLWKNFVDGRPEYWAFDNPYPTNLDNDDPQTLGQPCGYAIFKPSRDGSCGRTEEQVLREMKSVIAPPQREYTAWNIKYNREPLPSDNPHEVVAVAKREWQGMTDEEINSVYETCGEDGGYEYERAIESKLKEKNT